MDSLYEKLSKERKKLQAQGLMPSWWSTGSWQLFKAKYMYKASNPREQYERICHVAAKHAPKVYPSWWEAVRGSQTWEEAFFDEFWSGRFSGSTPVVSNTGTDRGFSISCSGNVMDNSIAGIYEAKKEVAVLTKNGFGTASYLGEIQPRGSLTAKGVVSSGVLPVIQGVVHDTSYVSQGSNRRGAWAAYLPLEHGDFDEVVKYLEDAPDGLNIGWNVTDKMIESMVEGDERGLHIFQEALTTKMKTGKGYYAFIDRINARRPQMYKDLGLYVASPQLCNEIHLYSDKDYTYTCVLSSLNAVHYHDAKRLRSAFVQTVFLDCIVSDFIEKADGVEGMQKAVEFTRKGRALGLGVCGFHTYLQMNNLPFEGFEAHVFNNSLFQMLHDDSLEASQWMAGVLGEPEWCKGYGVRNTHRTAVAPTKSSALIMGGVSEGINPDPAMTYLQLTPAGEVDRANPVLLQLMKDLGVYDKKHMQELTDAQGSVQSVSWLTPEQKAVFKTAFEIDQRAVLRLAGARQRWLCQGQSLNLFFAAEEDEEYIAEITSEAFQDENIMGLYYYYSKAGVAASKDECVACQ